ncbi:MAG: DUF429 domain-containing protein [Gammaproteobacteria bacterium]|nr:DUF429 domain-containing protein [Gammaproteobacteria bacterium]CAJ2376467.1 MAG: hypothetical protein IBGAMO2_340051 [Arenicellales bacterium IbO2]MDA7961436.1 DUF429 domain-containing protein [Gammaproteobacteria bacterium]MDA7969606.1 DUF429 domain-containing protein [Gammaproteobacteria bacterium]MDA7971849.1 DUF429 domain-containing protein [Gammaproteobacteria bacterium]
MKGVSLIGVDCATKGENIGLALGWCDDEGVVHIKDACAGMEWDDVTKKLIGWIAAEKVVLLALDAPLGWPVALRSNIRCHKAGKPLRHVLDDADKLFYRQTDLKMIKLYKRPLDVGANFIARTAHAALALLGELREKTGKKIRLAWTPGVPKNTQAIEVYPAATLIAHAGKDAAKIDKKFKSLSKKEKLLKKKEKILEKIKSAAFLDAKIKEQVFADESEQHVLDAVLCVLAAADFVRRDVIKPANCATRRRAKKEGWIWVKSPQSDAR